VGRIGFHRPVVGAGAVRGQLAGDVDVVLDRDRDAEQRRRLAGGDAPVGFLRLGEGTVAENDPEGIQPAVETIDVFDVYRGPELPNGRKSVAILVLMRDTERTLTDADGDRIVAGLLTTLTARFGATLRSQAAR